MKSAVESEEQEKSVRNVNQWGVLNMWRHLVHDCVPSRLIDWLIDRLSPFDFAFFEFSSFLSTVELYCDERMKRIETPKALYRFLIRQCARLPSEVGAFYKFQIKQVLRRSNWERIGVFMSKNRGRCMQFLVGFQKPWRWIGPGKSTGDYKASCSRFGVDCQKGKEFRVYLYRQSINQSINQSMTQSINQSINQSIVRSLHEVRLQCVVVLCCSLNVVYSPLLSFYISVRWKNIDGKLPGELMGPISRKSETAFCTNYRRQSRNQSITRISELNDARRVLISEVMKEVEEYMLNYWFFS